jgi:hypothetical protein
VNIQANGLHSTGKQLFRVQVVMILLVSVQVLHDLLVRSHTYLMYKHNPIEIRSDQDQAPTGLENARYFLQELLPVRCFQVFYDVGAQDLAKRLGCERHVSSVRKHMQMRVLGDVQVDKASVVCFTAAQVQAQGILTTPARAIPTSCDR